MKKNKKGFVVSAVLYPLLVLFLAIIMGLLSMTDTRKRILDKMKLEITDNIFDDAACSCDTILAKLNYIIANGTGGSGGDTGSYAYNKLTLNVKTYEAYSDFPVVGNIIGDIAVLSDTPIKNYYVSTSVPKSPQEGTVWIVQDNTSNYYVTSDWNRIGISYVMQYENSKWILKKSYVYNGESWTMLYHVPVKNGYVDLTGTDINAEITKTYDYTGKYQTFKAVFSGYYQFEAYGAQGGSGITSGGKGAYTSGEMYLNAGDIVYIYVGGTTTSTSGGWNGGGTGYTRGGGGATDIRLVATTDESVWNEFESLKSRIMVAAGGSGDSWYTGDSAKHRANGANGGTLIGVTGSSGWSASNTGTGASQSMGGYSLTNNLNTYGGFGYGGKAGTTTYSSGSGGGGGYYGGGGGDAISSGGGGSSYISGYEGCNSVSEESTEQNIIHNGSAYHYSNKYFINSSMTAGENAGNGKVVITLKTIQVMSKKEELNQIKNEKFNFTFSGVTKYSGRYQEFTVPINGNYKVELWGAQGGSGINSGGLGGYSYGNIYLKAGMKLYIYVGSQTLSTVGGWNGGGNGYTRGGGGATDIRLEKTTSLDEWQTFDSLKSRIMVAGAGSGDDWYTGDSAQHRVKGADGGGLSGANGTSAWNGYYLGTGGTQASTGYSKNANSATSSAFGSGGKAGTTTYSSGSGGGSGYYGGGGGDAISSGGGGSSYISGYEGCNSIAEESTVNNILHTGDAYHYSGYYFVSSNMEQGVNSGDGKAKITLIDTSETTESELEKYKSDNNRNWNFVYSSTTMFSGKYQRFIVPKDGIYKIDAYGAQGGSGILSGGLGAYTYGDIYLTKGTVLYIYVGGSTTTSSGGWNGGGNGYTRGGGGATDIRLINTSALTTWNEFESLKSRIMVAAGGSGDSWYTSDSAKHRANGANGGTLTGATGPSGWNGSYSGTGGTQSSQGYSVATRNDKVASGFGYGGNAGTTSFSSGSGGGSGYYGGAGGDAISSGGGGSSYISGYEGCNSIAEESTVNNIIHTGDAYHYSKKYFTNSSMEAGKNSGNGYAKITLVEAKTIDSETIINSYLTNDNIWLYSFSGYISVGRYQVFDVIKTGKYRFELWGAQGGSGITSGGLGGYTYGEISLTKGTRLYVYVGEQPLNTLNGGWNGGGNGYTRGGGGATDVRTVPTTTLTSWNLVASLNSRIMVASAGAGDSWYTGDSAKHRAQGGAGGGLIGYTGPSGWNGSYSGTGGQQNTTSLSLNNNAVTSSGFGYGGKAGTTSFSSASGGGSGWYGGSGGDAISSGGGGSSYISGHAGCIGVNSSGNPLATEYSKLEDSISYTGYKFINTTMIDGAGYPWNTEKSGSSSGMPSPTTSSTQTGQSGNGYAKITYLGA